MKDGRQRGLGLGGESTKEEERDDKKGSNHDSPGTEFPFVYKEKAGRPKMR
jgi:hypothetical protein